jgi:hypothetical protein
MSTTSDDSTSEMAGKPTDPGSQGKGKAKWVEATIAAGADCAAPIALPAGMDFVLPGGSPKQGYVKRNTLAFTIDGGNVLVCRASGQPTTNAAKFRYKLAAADEEDDEG